MRHTCSINLLQDKEIGELDATAALAARFLRTFAYCQLKAEIESGLGNGFALELTDQHFCGLVADVVARCDDGGDRWRGAGGPGQVVEAGNRHLLRHLDAATLAFEQGTQRQIVVAAEYGVA